MATPISSVADYCTLLTKSKLLPAEEVEALHRRWKNEANGHDDQTEAFGKYLIQRRVLTPYQTAMLQRGRADGFFLNGYKILDRIGKGQMGGVYKAVHTLGQLVALKILPSSKARDQHVLGRFQREARLLTQVDHPNVVRAYQVGEADRVHYIVMEFLEGETLEEVLERRTRLPCPEAVRLIWQALNGLQHLHDRRMVHRDLKPSNLMLIALAAGENDTTWNSAVKIVDIGLGRELFDDNTPEGQIETQLTVEGAVLGTPDYLAPEQARDARTADIRADIYSLGCVLYQSLTGRTPFPDANIMSQMLKHATEKPTPLEQLVPDVPPGLQQVLDVLMAKDVTQRFQTPEEAALALRPFMVRNAGVKSVAASLVPAYRSWLETESALEVNAGFPAPAPAVKPGTDPVKPLASSPPVSPRPAPSAPRSPAVPAPTYPPPVSAAPTYPPPAPPRRPSPRRPEPLPLEDEEMDVELVTIPAPAAVVPPPPAPSPFAVGPPVIVKAPDDRSLMDLNRRDMMLLGMGGFGVLAAVGMGYGLAQLIRRKPVEEVPPEKSE